MPVKVRCPECEKVLTLPDKARGKTAKCSNCEARVPVPAGGKQAGAPARRKKAATKKTRKPAGSPAVGGDDLFADLDLSRTEDRRVRVCPKCGLEVDEEDIECPKCGVVIATGRLSAERQRKKARGGPDTDKYYEKFFSSGLDFVKEHWKFGVRTMVYTMITNAIALFSIFMTLYCAKLPLKVFWGVLALLFALVGPGWCWFLATTLIQSAIDKKVKLDRVRFDFFLCSALGIKFYSWLIVFCFPFQIVTGTIGGLMIANDLLVGGLVIVALGFLPGFFCFPIVMSHMAMPVQWPGWLSPKIVPSFFHGLAAPSMYWCMFCAATMLPATIFAAISVFAFQSDISKLVSDLNHNARVAHVMAYEPPKKKANTEAEEIHGEVNTEMGPVSWWFFATKDQKIKERQYWLDQSGGGEQSPTSTTGEGKSDWEHELDTDAAIPPMILWFLAIPLFAFAAVFNMRTNGLFTYYFRPELELIMEEKQVKWEGRKSDDEFDEEGRELESSNVGKYFAGVGGTILFYVIVNLITYFGFGVLVMPRALARALQLVQ